MSYSWHSKLQKLSPDCKPKEKHYAIIKNSIIANFVGFAGPPSVEPEPLEQEWKNICEYYFTYSQNDWNEAIKSAYSEGIRDLIYVVAELPIVEINIKLN